MTELTTYMKRMIIVSVLILFHFFIKAQANNAVIKVLRQIELENISENLKDSILIYTNYYPPSEDSDYIEYYSLQIDSIIGSARIEYGFQSGQSAYSEDDIKLFKKSDNNYKVIYSHCTGANAMLNQNDLIIYDFDITTNLLKLDSTTNSIFDFKFKDFYKTGTPDSIIMNDMTPVEFYYDLFYPQKYDVELSLVSFLLSVNFQDNKNILGDIIGFKWINDRFIKSEPYYNE